MSGSDDFTMFLWDPSQSSKPLQRMTGHLQLINQVQSCCDCHRLGFWVCRMLALSPRPSALQKGSGFQRG